MSQASSVRRQSRELALQVLFQIEYDPQFDMKTSFSRFVTNFRPLETVVEYCEKLAFGVVEHQTEIDTTIQSHSPHWKISRMDRVDRNTLRIAVYELLFQHADVPPKVVINEAVEIGKTFGNAESASFINGILGQVARQKRLFDAPN